MNIDVIPPFFFFFLWGSPKHWRVTRGLDCIELPLFGQLCPQRYISSTFWSQSISITHKTSCHHGNGSMSKHYTDVIMTMMASQITSLTVVYSTVYSDADQRKHQSSASLAFVWGIHRDRWIPRTKGQLRGKCFHLMTSSWCITRICRRRNYATNTCWQFKNKRPFTRFCCNRAWKGIAISRNRMWNFLFEFYKFD